MKVLCFILAITSIGITGCTTGYRVYVNGFSELDGPIRDKASICVTVDPNSQNPIFDKQIKARIEELLKWYSYVPVAALELCDYRLAFQVGMDSRQASGYAPLYHPYVGLHGRYWRGYHFGYSTYVPYYDTLYDQRLVMKVFAHDRSNESAEEKIVWVGEAMTSTSGDDIRRVVDYLLVGCFEYFGVDTTRQRSLIVAENDPRIIQIEAFR